MGDLLPPQSTSTTFLPPLLAVPTEIKDLILSFFVYTEDAEPTLIILRRTHRVFRAIIPPCPYGPPCSHGPYRPYGSVYRVYRVRKLIRAELEYQYLFPPGMLPCYRCKLVLDSSAFGKFITMSIESGLHHSYVGPESTQISLGVQGAGFRECNHCMSASIQRSIEAAHRPRDRDL